MKSYLLVFIFTFVWSGAVQAEGPICDYKASKSIKVMENHVLFTASVQYDNKSCIDSMLLVKVVNNINGEIIYKDTHSFQHLNYYGPSDESYFQAVSKDYADGELYELTPLHSWPEFEYSDAEPGMSKSDEVKRIHGMKNISDPERWDLLEEVQICSTVEYSISRDDYERFRKLKALIFQLADGESGEFMAYDSRKKKLVPVASGC